MRTFLIKFYTMIEFELQYSNIKTNYFCWLFCSTNDMYLKPHICGASVARCEYNSIVVSFIPIFELYEISSDAMYWPKYLPYKCLSMVWPSLSTMFIIVFGTIVSSHLDITFLY
jgi:hypothetical protein